MGGEEIRDLRGCGRGGDIEARPHCSPEGVARSVSLDPDTESGEVLGVSPTAIPPTEVEPGSGRAPESQPEAGWAIP